VGFGFRPHGIYIDNSTQRLFAISHSDLLEEESIVVFDIVAEAGSRVPALDYLYALISPSFPYNPPEEIWFLNDLATVGRNELYVTQFGPQRIPWPNKHLWRCTWDEADLRGDGRLPASCHTAYPQQSTGLNGMNVDRAKSRVWANDLMLSQLWVFDRMENGTLVRLDNMNLPGIIDNVEYDSASGDLAMGFIGSGLRNPGGAIISRHADAHRPFIHVQEDTGEEYQVSTSLEYTEWVLLGSPWDIGLVICNTGTGHRSNATLKARRRTCGRACKAWAALSILR